MTDFIYYSVASVDGFTPKAELPDYLQKHAYKAESVCAWALLIESYKKVFNEDLPVVSFLQSGKPIINNGYISISHSNGVVAVCFSKTKNVGIDVEMIKPELYKNVSKFISATSPNEFYSLWTKREAVIKAKNYSALKKGAELEFVGEASTIKANEKAFSLAVYGENAKFIKV